MSEAYFISDEFGRALATLFMGKHSLLEIDLDSIKDHKEKEYLKAVLLAYQGELDEALAIFERVAANAPMPLKTHAESECALIRAVPTPTGTFSEDELESMLESYNNVVKSLTLFVEHGNHDGFEVICDSIVKLGNALGRDRIGPTWLTTLTELARLGMGRPRLAQKGPGLRLLIHRLLMMRELPAANREEFLAFLR